MGSFWEDLGFVHAHAGGSTSAVAGNYNQAQVAAAAGLTIQQNQGRVTGGRGSQNMNTDTSGSWGSSAVGKIVNAPFKLGGAAFHDANSGLGWAYEGALHDLSMAYNVGDIANEHGNSQWHPLYSFTDWKNAWNETSGSTVTDPVTGQVKPGFGASVAHSALGKAAFAPLQAEIGLTRAAFGGGLKGSFGFKDTGSVFGQTPEAKANMDAMIAEQNTWTGKIAAGAIDIAATWQMDPFKGLSVLTKAAKAASFVPDAEHAAGTVEAASQLNRGETQLDTGVGRVLSTPGSKTGLFSKAMTESGQRLFKFVTSTDNGENAAHVEQMLQRTPDAAPVLSLFKSADKIEDLEVQRQVKLDIIGAAQGNAVSRQRLIQSAPDIARSLMRSSLASEGRIGLDQMADSFARINDLDPATLDAHGSTFQQAAEALATPENMDELSKYGRNLDNIHARLSALDQIADNTPLEQAGLTALDRAKAAIRGKVASEFYYQDGVSGATVRALHWSTSQRFRGSIDVQNSLRGKQELLDFMTRQRFVDRQAGDVNKAKLWSADGGDAVLWTADERQKIADAFATAPTQEQRRRVVDSVWNQMYDKIGTRYNKTPQEIKRLQRQSGSVRIHASKYATQQMEKARMNGENRVILHDPGSTVATSVDAALYSTHIANNAVLPEINMIQDHILSLELGGKNVDMLGSAARQFSSKADKFNNVWRLAVLARPGLLMRTQIDTQGRALATMGASRVIANALQGLGHSLNKAWDKDPDALIQVSQTAADLHRADLVEQEADHLKWLADHADFKLPDFTDVRPEEAFKSTEPGVPTLSARGEELASLMNRGEGSAVASRPVMAADDYTHLGIPVPPDQYTSKADLLARERMLRASVNDIRDTKQWATKYALGTQDEWLTIGGRKVQYRGYANAQEQADRASSVYKGGAPSQAMQQKFPSTMGELIQDTTGKKMQRLYENSENYITHMPDSKYWSAAWIRSTDHIRNTHTGRVILQRGDHATADLVQALRSDPRVKREYREVADDNGSFTDYISRAIDHVAGLAPTSAVRQALLGRGHMSTADVDALFAKTVDDGTGKFTKLDAADPRPERVHVQGPEFSPLPFPGRETPGAVTNQMGKFVRFLSDKPDLAWGRHPVYLDRKRTHFTDLAQRAFDQNPEWERLPYDVQAKIDRVAQHRAIQDTQQLMYDTAKHTGAHATLRYMSPFMGAWQDAMESWGRLFYDDPRRAGAFWKVWNTPNFMGLVVDQNDNPIPPGGSADQSYILLPSSFSNDFKNSTKWRVRKDSLNSIFQGAQWYTPGFGPIVQVPAQEIVARAYPQLGDSSNPLVKSILPYGTPKTSTNPNPLMGGLEDLTDNVLPGWARGVMSMVDPSDPNNARAYMASVNEQIINARKAGKPIPSKAELDRKASHATSIAGLVRSMSLFGFGVTGEREQVADFYKKQYDQFQAQAQALYQKGTSPTEEFVRKFPEAAGLQWSLSHSETGISATIKAYNTEQKFMSEIKANPQYGWFYVGGANVGANDFSGSVYNAQSSKGIPGTSGPERKLQTRDELLTNSLAEDGWNRYNNFQIALKQKLTERGLYSISQKGADDLQAIRSQFITSLRKENPDWSQDFDTQDAGKLNRFVDSVATPALSDPKLKNRPDIQVLGEYLKIRQQALDLLAPQGIKSLSAGAASQARAVLDQYGETLAAQNLGFQQIWSRMLQKEVLPSAKDQLEAGQ